MTTTLLRLEMIAQPDDLSCGPACLHAVYRFHGDAVDFEELSEQVRSLESGGTLASWLGVHALDRGYSATLYTYNLRLFDPTWFVSPGILLQDRLIEQARAKNDVRLHAATRAYLSFLKRGGEIHFEDLTVTLLGRLIERNCPIVTGLSATYLHRIMRERMWDEEYDAIHGTSAGHFVVISGYDSERNLFQVHDPLLKMDNGRGGSILTTPERLIGAIFLGVLTHDSDLLVLQPREKQR